MKENAESTTKKGNEANTMLGTAAVYEGFTKGEICNRNGCDGIIEHERDGGCSCHINPPCSYCTDDGAYCPKCGWDNEYIPQPQTTIIPIRYEKPIVVDDGKKYIVRRFFDDVFEAVVETNLTKPEARALCANYNSKERAYVHFDISEQKSSSCA
jgi:hypothetical protein